MKYLLGIDFGGGASKATLLSEEGKIVAENTVEYPTYYDESGAAEQAPADWLDALAQNTHAVLCGVDPADVAAVAIDSATHTSLVTDGDMRPLRRAMHWTDSRSRAESKQLLAEHGAEIFEKTYHKPDTIWTLPQLLWLKNHESELFSKVRYIFFEKDYIRYYLTGVYATDDIEAEGSMLFDCRTRTWDARLCALAGITPEMLPPIGRPHDVIGAVTKDAASATGLAAGTPVIMGTTDTVMEVFASGAVKPGDMTVKLATAGRICVITDRPYPDRHIINYSHVVGGLFYPGTATKSAAASYRWYRDTFGGEYPSLDAGAAALPIGAEGLLFHPYLNGELTPYASPALSGSFTGVRATHTGAHFTRAVLEGVAYSLLDCKRYLDTLGMKTGDRATLIGGGAKGALWAQMTADVLGLTLVTTRSSDSSLGSAMLAGIAMGIFPSPEEAVRRCISEKEVYRPDPERTAAYHKVFDRYRRIAEALLPIYEEEA